MVFGHRTRGGYYPSKFRVVFMTLMILVLDAMMVSIIVTIIREPGTLFQKVGASIIFGLLLLLGLTLTVVSIVFGRDEWRDAEERRRKRLALREKGEG